MLTSTEPALIDTDQAPDVSDLGPRRKSSGSPLKPGKLEVVPGEKSAYGKGAAASLRSREISSKPVSG
ncbi:MAG TPA: hypothetical protein VNX88_00870 [Terriglobales bacterium]|nr:hypothetical protein [Terriglobales bacterium]